MNEAYKDELRKLNDILKGEGHKLFYKYYRLPCYKVVEQKLPAIRAHNEGRQINLGNNGEAPSLEIMKRMLR